jgi:hypothetical protein
MNLDTPLKLKVMVTYSWEELIDPKEYGDEFISNIKEHYILTGAYQDRIEKLDTRAANCLPDDYKCNVDLKWADN